MQTTGSRPPAYVVGMYRPCGVLEGGVKQKIEVVTRLSMGDTALEYILGVRRWTKTEKVQLRFLDLALIVAKRSITMRWKSARAPTTSMWHNKFLRWAGAESAALRREEARGLRKNPISLEWDTMVEDYKNTNPDDVPRVPSTQ